MMESTLADNSSTRPCASRRKGEQKIAPFASRRHYDCKRLHIADPVYPPIVINDGTAPSRWNHLIDRNILQRSEEHTSELQSLMRISYAVFCLKKKKK